MLKESILQAGDVEVRLRFNTSDFTIVVIFDSDLFNLKGVNVGFKFPLKIKSGEGQFMSKIFYLVV